MTGPVLLAVAHGSSDPAAAATIRALARQVTRLAPVLDVRVAFVQHAEPSLADGVAAAGPDAVIVPLLLSTGYHLTSDIAGAAGPASRIAPALGPDQLLATALAGRLADAGVPAGTPVVLAAAGSADPAAQSAVAEQARLLADLIGAEVVPAYTAAAAPTVPEAVERLRERTGGPVAVASYLLAPGQFHDRLAESGADWVTAPIGDHPAAAGLVIDRYRASSIT